MDEYTRPLLECCMNAAWMSVCLEEGICIQKESLFKGPNEMG